MHLHAILNNFMREGWHIYERRWAHIWARLGAYSLVFPMLNVSRLCIQS